MARNEAEIAWCERVAGLIDAGQGMFVAELPAGSDWRSGFAMMAARSTDADRQDNVLSVRDTRRPRRRRDVDVSAPASASGERRRTGQPVRNKVTSSQG